MKRLSGCGALAFAGLLLLQAGMQVQAAALEPAQQRGKQIYLTGESASGEEITATVGSEGLTLPASAVPCGSCHGADGLGQREGGVAPPDIRWSELTKIYGHVHENGRSHEAFSEVSVARLIRSGRDPAHNQIDVSMPRYAMSKKDMDDLVEYLRFIEFDIDPGLKDDSIQVATLLPLRGPKSGMGSAMAQVMLGYFKELNKNGGVYGRKIELLAVPYGDTPQATLDNLSSAFESEGIFAVVGAYTVGLDEEILDILRKEGAPLLGPFTLNPGNLVENEFSFYMYPGFGEQLRALVQLARENKVEGDASFAVVGPSGSGVDHMIDALGEDLPEDENDRPLRYESGNIDASALAAEIEQRGNNSVVFLGNQAELNVLLGALDARKLNPRIFLLSAFMTQPLYDAPAAFDKRIYVAYPTLSKDLSEKGRSEYLRLADLHALPRNNVQSQIVALAASKLLVEGLRGAGRVLSRKKLMEAVEALYRFDTGMTPPLTYGPNRRIGARGAHIMVVDMEKKTNTGVGEWRDLQ